MGLPEDQFALAKRGPKRAVRRLRSSKGVSLAELMVTILLMGLVMSAMVRFIVTAINLRQTFNRESECQMLERSLNSALESILTYTTEICGKANTADGTIAVQHLYSSSHAYPVCETAGALNYGMSFYFGRVFVLTETENVNADARVGELVYQAMDESRVSVCSLVPSGLYSLDSITGSKNRMTIEGFSIIYCKAEGIYQISYKIMCDGEELKSLLGEGESLAVKPILPPRVNVVSG